jgi:DNA-binding MarR family transcriptional regulator
MSDFSDEIGVGTLLRHLLELLDGEVAAVERELGLVDYRPRYSPVVRALVAGGPMPIREVARAVGVTHSAASQTVAQMARAGWVRLEPGPDARQRIVHLASRTQALLPVITAEWVATEAAMRELDAELPVPFAEFLMVTMQALERRPLRQRIADSGVLDDLLPYETRQPRRWLVRTDGAP